MRELGTVAEPGELSLRVRAPGPALEVSRRPLGLKREIEGPEVERTYGEPEGDDPESREPVREVPADGVRESPEPVTRRGKGIRRAGAVSTEPG